MRIDEFVAEHGRELSRLAYLLCRDSEAAQDLVQSTLVNAVPRWPRISTMDHALAYVRRMLVNEFLSGQRRARLSLAERVIALEATTPDPSEQVVARMVVGELLDSLAPRARSILVLRYYWDLTDGQVADELGISTSTVRATIARALATLRGRDLARLS